MESTKEADIALQFVNHHEKSQRDLCKEALRKRRFYEARMDWDMIVGYNFMMETDSGVLPAQASVTLNQDNNSRCYCHLNTMWSANGSTLRAISSK